jgi:hypothetical protein
MMMVNLDFVNNNALCSGIFRPEIDRLHRRRMYQCRLRYTLDFFTRRQKTTWDVAIGASWFNFDWGVSAEVK